MSKYVCSKCKYTRFKTKSKAKGLYECRKCKNVIENRKEEEKNRSIKV